MDFALSHPLKMLGTDKRESTVKKFGSTMNSCKFVLEKNLNKNNAHEKLNVLMETHIQYHSDQTRITCVEFIIYIA